MQNVEAVKETFGPEVAQTIQESHENPWSIQRALTTDYTRRELNPPKPSNYNSSTVNARIGTSEPLWTVVISAKRSYELSSKSEAIKKLLRYGTRAIAFEHSHEKLWFNRWEQANSILSEYIEGETELVSSFHENKRSATRQANDGSIQNRVLWYQKAVGSKLSEELDLSNSEIFHLAVLLAGRRLGTRGEIAEVGLYKINNKIEDFEVSIGPHKRQGYGAIYEALQTDYAKEVIQRLERESPNIWVQFVEDHYAVSASIERFWGEEV